MTFITQSIGMQACATIPKLMHIRNFHAIDKAAVLEICKRVLCGHKRGSTWFVFGLRVHEGARGQGVGRALVEHICRACSGYGAVQHITTATTPETPAAVRILTGVGLTHTHTVDVWPTYTALSAFEQQVGFVAGCQELPKYHTTLLEFIAGAHRLMAEASRGLGVALGDWVQCSSLEQLQQAVASIRQQQRLQDPDLQQLPSTVPLDWLPWVYETWPLDAPYIQDRTAGGDIWLLPSPAAAAAGQNGSPLRQFRAAVLLAWSPEFRRRCAGVLTAGDAFVPPALEFVGNREPHFVAFVDRGSRHSSGKPDPDVVLPEVLTMPEGENSCFSVYTMPAAHAWV